jgi:D-alanyl-D-alanine carboxypeptidase/D-alanyl-D-alanine-endopeptidase (penicillin-binding protein 4)
MSAKLLAEMLDHAYDRYGSRWMETLSISGVDGTIKKRFRNTVVKNRAWMKTGTLKRVKNIGGYVKNKVGKYYTVVIIINSSKAKYSGAKLQNEIMEWLAKSSAKPTLRSSPQKVINRKVTKKKSTSDNLFTNVKTKSLSKTKHVAKDSAVKYYLQAGSFSSMPNEAYLLKIKALGLHYIIRHTDNYKVLIGAYSDEKNARNALEKVREHISSGAFIVKL